MGANNEYSRLDHSIECLPGTVDGHIADIGHVAAFDNMSLKDGSTIVTKVVGTPQDFVGTSHLIDPKTRDNTMIPVDSRNIGEKSLVGKVAAAAQEAMKTCWGKVGPSF